jgi:hypothetical protein
VAAASSLSFAGGPFLVHRDFVLLALVRVTAFANNVAVYQLTADTAIDVRYQLTLKPTIAVSNVNTRFHSDIMDAAVIPNYTVVNPTTLTAASCYTSHSEPHTTVTAGVPFVRTYIQSGANFMAQCHAIDTVERVGGGFFQSTTGEVINNDNTVLTYPNADLAFVQIVGPLNPNPGGSEQDFSLAGGSVFQNNAHVLADNPGASPATWAATGAKLYNGPGGMVMYLGGHDYSGASALNDINGERMYLNFLFMPTTRPAGCSLDFYPAPDGLGQCLRDVNGDGPHDGVGDRV